MPFQFYLIFFAFPRVAYVENTDLVVEVRYPKIFMQGKFTPQGTFVPEHISKSGNFFGSSSCTLANWSAGQDRPVFELRSSILIKGIIDTEGFFVPDVNTKPIRFPDYQFFRFSPPIWNLPGTFEVVKPKKN